MTEAPRAFVPAAGSAHITPLEPRPKPTLSTFFTGRPEVEKHIEDLEEVVEANKRVLRNHNVYPLPPALQLKESSVGRSAREAIQERFMGIRDNETKRIMGLLREITTMRRIARLSGQGDVVADLSIYVDQYKRTREVLERQERALQAAQSAATTGDATTDGATTDDAQARKMTGQYYFDNYGRAVAVGRKKTARAKVLTSLTPRPEPTPDRSEVEAEANPDLPVSNVLINHLSIEQHFTRPQDREIVLRPLRLTGTLGQFNIFALTAGGGISSQASAVAMGVARGLVGFYPKLREVLKKDGLIDRDPRVVERKKTNRAKARKRVSWILESVTMYVVLFH